jgi:hypothetical protein
VPSLANDACISFVNGSRLNSSAEHGKPISNFSSTLGCRIPSVPIAASLWTVSVSAAFTEDRMPLATELELAGLLLGER